MTPPTLISIDPVSGPNDLDTPIVLTGTDFANLPSAPMVYLGETELMDVTWIDATALHATIPWGMDYGIYSLTVINPNGESATLLDAFTVTQGIGEWNGGELYGGYGKQLLFKPGAPNTVYAVADSVGLFRSQDAGVNWAMKSISVIGNGSFVVDPHHPSWLYSANGGLYRSTNEGDSWELLFNEWPGNVPGEIFSISEASVFVSPYNLPEESFGRLFFSSRDTSYPLPYPSANGLIYSDDDGASWTVVDDLVGVGVSDLDFNPSNSDKMILSSIEGLIYESVDGGLNWVELTTQPPVVKPGIIAYNPNNAGEVWVSEHYLSGNQGVYKSSIDLSSWQAVTPPSMKAIYSIKFSSTSVFLAEAWGNIHRSDDGGTTWQAFGGDLWKTTACCDVLIHPVNEDTIYIGDMAYGVKKSIDDGETWEVVNQGLAAMYAGDLSVSPAFPQRIYGLFRNYSGVYRSVDGAGSWDYFPISNTQNVAFVREDPFESQRIYVAGGPNMNVSTNGGLNWENYPWGTEGNPYAMDLDRFQDGRVLVGLRYGPAGDYAYGRLVASNDHGQTWNPINVIESGTLDWITDINFDPKTPGLVYLTTAGSGIYRSVDHGDTWERIDDLSKTDMGYTATIEIATHPQPMLMTGTYRSLDGGDSWNAATVPPLGAVNSLLFPGGDSNYLYAGTWFGLYLSRDGGESWTAAAGELGNLNITAQAAGVAGDRAILYAATTGSTGTSTSFGPALRSPLILGGNSMGAGVYRYVRGIWEVFMPMVRQ